MIGAGPGGYVAAIRAAQLGAKVACIDKGKTLGGTCLNVGCIPSKVLLHDSEMQKSFQEMMQRKKEVVKGFTGGIEFLFKKNKVEWIQGDASFQSPHEVGVNGKTIQARNIILATGSEPIPLPFAPFDEKVVLSSTGALELERVPKKLVIVGAGVIGVELGSVYQRLGTEVIFVEFLDRICPAFDGAVSKALLKVLQSQGMQFYLSYKVTQIKGGDLVAESSSQESLKLSADHFLVAVGRRPFTKGLGLEKAGIQVDAKGFIPINRSFQTTQRHIFAIGDLVEGPMLAHKASEEGVAVAELIMGEKPTVDYFAIPNVAYTHPEVASVGLTEEEVKKRNLDYISSQFPFKANSRARCIGDETGFVKILAEKQSQKILGVHILGPNGSELIATATLAIKLGGTAKELAATCFAHPTLSEAIKEAAIGTFGAPLHI